jgi:hypothetical protein
MIPGFWGRLRLANLVQSLRDEGAARAALGDFRGGADASGVLVPLMPVTMNGTAQQSRQR